MLHSEMPVENLIVKNQRLRAQIAPANELFLEEKKCWLIKAYRYRYIVPTGTRYCCNKRFS